MREGDMGFLPLASRLILAGLFACAGAMPLQAADAAKKPADNEKTVAAPAVPQGGRLEQELVYKATVGNSGEIRELIERGAQADKAYNTENVPALSLAAQRKDIDAISVMGALIKGGANVNIKDGYGQSPLFYAAKAGLVDNVRYLLESGAVYYQTDLKGNIARNVAHAEGYDEVVKEMDEFVATQTQSVINAYADRDKKIEEQYRQRADEQAAALAALQKHEKELANALKAEKAEKAPVKRGSGSEDVDEVEFKKLVYDLSYHTCAATYWEFCRSRRLSSSLEHSGIKNQLEAHETLAKTAADTLTTDFRAKKNYLNRIIGPSQSNLLDQFKIYPTNAHLKSAGVGEKKDMDERCGFIAESWDVKPRKRAPAPKPVEKE